MMGKSHEEFMIEQFRADPAFAVDLLNDVLRDGDRDELTRTIQRMSAAFCDNSGATENTSDIASLIVTLHAMGLRLSVTPKPTPRKRSAQPKATKRAGRVRRSVAKPEKVHA
jgi:DNA-binding phage protein